MITSVCEHPGNHCAWCGDPPDVYGSHTICALHAAHVYAELAALRQARQERTAAQTYTGLAGGSISIDPFTQPLSGRAEGVFI